MPVSRITPVSLAAVLVAMATPAFAASGSDEAPAAGKPPPAVTRQAARDMAWRLGIVQIEEIALDGIRWEIAGRDESGNERILDIDAYDGSVLQ
jgi:hypothetical protein